MFKPNILVLVGRLYDRGDYKRDEAFSLFYMIVNAGALGGALLCGWTALKWGWHAGFLAASLGIGTCAVLLIALRPLVPRDDATPRPAPIQKLWQLAGACGLIVLVSLLVAAAAGGASVAIDAAWLAKWATAGIAIIAATYFVYMLTIGAANTEERRGVSAVFVLFLCGTIFIFGFEQAGSWLTLFADRLTRRTIGDFEIPAAWFTGANAALVVLFAPLLTVFWSSREALGRAFSIAQKLAIGLLLVSCGFIVVAYAATLAGPLVKVAPMWLLATYALHTLGELCISPVSLSAISRVAPARLVSQLMGAWYMSAALGSVASGALTNLISFEDAELSSRFVFTAFVIATGGLLLLSAARRLKALSL
jgi:POT family proton-dependent oligopeptide transporter